ncbi:Uncharacterized protein TPAR_04366 [Tolypocladium paradoxum]|uniref:GMPS ATP-PPase domain-containing protein n=1 Tax=Tolypocladium paradoxum TaxID=94208 RepID=A0A2S4KZ20_9HYPO|nr:Uncharacterized protein TPAR_04366 [Tolypocladium paradoxum]
MSSFIEQEITRIRKLVDNGVMRLNECQQTLAEHLGVNLTIADAPQKFLSGLKDVVDPEKKRKFIGNTFIDIFEEEAIKIDKAAENTPNAELVMRHPFPGPGIAMRILGDVTPERVEIARKADHILIR